MTTHPDPHAEKVARLRYLADFLPDGRTFAEAADALREYADLLEKSRQGVTEDVVKVAMQGYRRSVAEQAGNWSNNDDSPLKAMHAAILAVAPLLAAMPPEGAAEDRHCDGFDKLVAELESDPESAAQLADARKWVREKFYPAEDRLPQPGKEER